MSDSRDFSLFTGSTAENNRIHCKQTDRHTHTNSLTISFLVDDELPYKETQG